MAGGDTKVDDVGPTDGETGHENHVGEQVEVGHHPECYQQQETAPGVHGHGVMQWVTHGHIAVSGHGGQGEAVSDSTGHEEVHLGKALGKGDLLALAQHVCQHFGHADIYKADVHKDRLERKKYVGVWRQASPRWL